MRNERCLGQRSESLSKGATRHGWTWEIFTIVTRARRVLIDNGRKTEIGKIASITQHCYTKDNKTYNEQIVDDLPRDVICNIKRNIKRDI